MAKADKRTRRNRTRASRTGVDLTLIRWMASLTPTERLAVLHDHIKLVSTSRRAATTD